MILETKWLEYLLNKFIIFIPFFNLFSIVWFFAMTKPDKTSDFFVRHIYLAYTKILIHCTLHMETTEQLPVIPDVSRHTKTQYAPVYISVASQCWTIVDLNHCCGHIGHVCCFYLRINTTTHIQQLRCLFVIQHLKLLLFCAILLILWKQNHPLKRNVFFTRCLPIAFTR